MRTGTNPAYAKADVVAEKLRSRIDAKAVGSITADERSNQILVRVFPGRHDEVEKILREKSRRVVFDGSSRLPQVHRGEVHRRLLVKLHGAASIEAGI